MKEKVKPLTIFNFSHPLMNTEVMSVTSDKYAVVLDFSWEITNNYESADVILWDGVITPKNLRAVERMLEDIKTGKVLLMTGESLTLMKNHPIVKILNTENLNCVELPGWNILPEEFLNALEICHKKCKHV